MKKVKTFKCKYCGKKKKQVREWQKFCNSECKNSFHNELRRKAIDAYEQQKEI